MFRSTLIAVYPLLWTILAYFYVLPIVTGSAVPLSVVISGSMEPSIHVGDVLFSVSPEDATVGDIVVFKVPNIDIPIVHRIIKTTPDGVLTKGDANQVDDRFLYPTDFKSILSRDLILGKVRGQIPWIGYITILFNPIRPLVITLAIAHALYDGLKKHKNTRGDDGPMSSFEWLAFFIIPCWYKTLCRRNQLIDLQ